ncbi:DUF3226 domain-containing protein [Methylobacterium sp. J-068]|uniref:DUF3226 domain-containing protein n=1 Tax=Methylobacterium sp. J-068 TaxID=2836649 RepID=UPI001FBA6554|nr:DUF3226 domain-containing protein [Methylobacterium sp. J-068]MCJ2035953.1 hypothetical protein [Methylobacterium sp. J-068]
MRQDRVLLVEGPNDKFFFEAMCRSLGLSTIVKVASPQDIAGPKVFNNKGGIFKILPLLISQMNDGSIASLGVIVDADTSATHGMGVEKTLELFAQKIEKDGFRDRRRVGDQGGYVFKNNDGLGDIGLWIMPDNQSEGMLENWVYSTARGSERADIAHAEKAIATLPGQIKFKEIHRIKAITSVWMS